MFWNNESLFEKFKDGEKFINPAVVADSQNTVTWLQLIRDVNFKCSLCGQELLKDGLNKAISNYDIVHVFPDNLAMKDQSKFFKIKNVPEDSDALDNNIPLCLNCENLYLKNPTLVNYQSLANTERRITIECHLSEDLNQLSFEDDLIKVIKGLKNIKPDIKAVSISYDAHKVEEKIRKTTHYKNQSNSVLWDITTK